MQSQSITRNKGVKLQPDWFEQKSINLSCCEKRASTMISRRSIKKEYQASWLVNAISCIDLTTLSGDDTKDRVARLCSKAKFPLSYKIVSALGLQSNPPACGAVCVYPTMVNTAVKFLQGSGIPVASVASGFPAGLIPLKLRIQEIQYAVEEGANEIDIVITRSHVFNKNWNKLYDEISCLKEACGSAHMKTILATGDLVSLRNVYMASMVAMQAGSDFIKTSTGKEVINATLPVSLVMVRAIRDYYDRTGFEVGFKAAGGLKSAKDAISWQIMIKEELDIKWLRPSLFRMGTSSMLKDIERQLSYYVTGAYSAYSYHAIA